MRSLVLASLFVSTIAAFGPSSAFACPNLAGKYKECRNAKDETISYDMVVSQKIHNKVTLIAVTVTDAMSQTRESETYKTDGKTVVKTYEDPDSGMIMQVKTVSSCDGSILNIDREMSLNGEMMGWSKVKVTKKKNQLLLDTQNFDGQEETMVKEVCE